MSSAAWTSCWDSGTCPKWQGMKTFKSQDRSLPQAAAPTGLWRREATPAPVPEELPSSVQAVLRAPGRPLEPDTRRLMETRFGHDFSRVRIHADNQAAEAARSINALAFTLGRDVVFGQGRYAPETDSGLRLLSHELTHVVQQQGAQVSLQRAIDSPRDSLLGDTEEPTAGKAKEIPAVLQENIDLSALAAEPSETMEAEPHPESPEDEKQPSPAIAAQMAGPVPEVVRNIIIPSEHASEREADAMSAWAGARNPRQPRPVINHYRALRAPARKPAPLKPVPQGKPRRRLNLVFIMGADRKKAPRNKRFYTAAHVYFETKVPHDAIIDDAEHRNLAAVFEYLRTLNPREVAIGNLYLVAHANEDGTLSFPLDAGEEALCKEEKKKKKPDLTHCRTTFPQLKEALGKQPHLFSLPPGLIDANSIIHIKGCNIGRSAEMLNKIDEAFGGQGKVTAPTHKQEYQAWHDSKGKVIEAHEALAVYYLEFPGLVKLTHTQQLARFRSKYAFLSEKRWKTLLGKKGAQRTVLTPLQYDVIAPKGSEDKALEKAKEWGDPLLTRPEMYAWRIVSKTKQKDKRILYHLEANKTNFTVNKMLTEETGKRLEPKESEPEFFGVSGYEAPERKPTVSVTPVTLSVAALFEGIADLRQRIQKLPTDDAEMRRDLTADWQALEDDVRKRPAKMSPAQIIKVIADLAGTIGKLAGKDAGIRKDLLLACAVFYEELPRRAPHLAAPDIVAHIEQLTAAIASTAGGDAEVRGKLMNAKTAYEDELSVRKIMVDVRVVKTEDWLGADEVYVRLAGARHTQTTSEVKLNDGQSHTFKLLTAPFLPLNTPFELQVYDEDWPDADDLIVQLEWKPPFAPTANTESFDKADYRVKLHFDK